MSSMLYLKKTRFIMNAIDIQGLVKRYKKGTLALDGVNLSIKKGDFFGLLGLNGAGKTTLISILVGLVKPTEGSIQLMGHDLIKDPSVAKRSVGIVPQEVNMNVFATVKTVMFNHGGYYGLSRSVIEARYRDILQEVGLADKESSRVFQLSGGMKRRLLLARALLIDPDILILDEPTAGVDVDLRQKIWDILTRQNKAGKTILLTSHYMEEVEHLCHNLAVLHNGKIVDSGRKEDLLGLDQSRSLVLHFGDEIESLPEHDLIEAIRQDARSFLLNLDPDASLSKYLQAVEKAGHQVSYVSSPTTRLELYFRSKTR